jgi:2-polyprenyl-3-methyl-5-hydroxy-6-metoxy-1,4-benzoquinol methylase
LFVYSFSLAKAWWKIMINRELQERDRAEVERSAEEARHTLLQRAQVRRYLSPPADTPYPLEYAFHLLGDISGKEILDFGCGTGENIIPLVKRGGLVTAIDVSPELIAIAERRVSQAGVRQNC